MRRPVAQGEQHTGFAGGASGRAGGGSTDAAISKGGTHYTSDANVPLARSSSASGHDVPVFKAGMTCTAELPHMGKYQKAIFFMLCERE